jgi:hypothetical protein
MKSVLVEPKSDLLFVGLFRAYYYTQIVTTSPLEPSHINLQFKKDSMSILQLQSKPPSPAMQPNYILEPAHVEILEPILK